MPPHRVPACPWTHRLKACVSLWGLVLVLLLVFALLAGLPAAFWR
jgi:hypothetical protein